jgi:hypothetical protein
VAAASTSALHARKGTLLVVSHPDVASATLDGIGDACRRLLAGDGDAEVALARFTIAHRVRSLVAFRGARLLGVAMHRRLAKRLQVRHLFGALDRADRRRCEVCCRPAAGICRARQSRRLTRDRVRRGTRCYHYAGVYVLSLRCSRWPS